MFQARYFQILNTVPGEPVVLVAPVPEAEVGGRHLAGQHPHQPRQQVGRQGARLQAEVHAGPVRAPEPGRGADGDGDSVFLSLIIKETQFRSFSVKVPLFTKRLRDLFLQRSEIVPRQSDGRPRPDGSHNKQLILSHRKKSPDLGFLANYEKVN